MIDTREAVSTESQLGLIGASVPRVEDEPLVTGLGHYVDDIQLPGMLHVAFLRSPYPHARIRGIDATAAQTMPGVVTVLVGADLEDHLNITAPQMVPGMKVPPQPILARGAVHAVGVPVAAVAAETRAQAEDAVHAIDVDYESLPSVADVEAAVAPGAPLAREELSDNICFTVHRDGGDVERAFAEADHVTGLTMRSPRQVAMALEPRGVAASPDPLGHELTVWLSTQSPHRVRADLATTLRFPENRIRLIAPDVGGGFGSKGPLYREDVVVCYLALKLRRPVKWTADRMEDFQTTIQGRDQLLTSELALTREGTMLGLKVRVLGNLGAYLQSNTAGPPQRMMTMAPGCYQIRNVQVEVLGVFTNTVPTGPYRGAGRPEAVLNIERLADQAARELGLDPIEIRRQNFIRPDQFPYHTATGVHYDSGDYARALDEALRLADYENLVRQREDARARGELAGIGVSTFVEPSGGVGFESGTIRVERTGVITVLTGSSAHGQGHETVYAQIVADKLHASMASVAVRHGDTFIVQQGTGTFGSRSMVTGGGAAAIAADRIEAKARRVAAVLLETSSDEIEPIEGGFAARSRSDLTVTWRQVAAAAWSGRLRDDEPGLQETVFFDPGETWGFGTHIAMVRIDRETGKSVIDKLVLVDDCGVMINPQIVEGQVHGGVAQGLGEAFREQMIFDEDGNILSGSLADYAVTDATEMPPLTLGETVTPNPNHPLGVKGVGEAATNGSPAALANAVMDALAPLGIKHLDMPFTAPKLWAAIHAAEGA